jgi:hypothetical protein
MNQPTNSEALPLTNCSSSFWDTPETDAVSNRWLGDQMVPWNLARKFERERDEAIKEGAKHISLWHQTLREMEILKFGPENIPANNNQNQNQTE